MWACCSNCDTRFTLHTKDYTYLGVPLPNGYVKELLLSSTENFTHFIKKIKSDGSIGNEVLASSTFTLHQFASLSYGDISLYNTTLFDPSYKPDMSPQGGMADNEPDYVWINKQGASLFGDGDVDENNLLKKYFKIRDIGIYYGTARLNPNWRFWNYRRGDGYVVLEAYSVPVNAIIQINNYIPALRQFLLNFLKERHLT